MMLVNVISITARKPAWPILRRYALLALASVAGSFIGIKLLLMPPSARLQPALPVFSGAVPAVHPAPNAFQAA